jgi:hypothetical protein
MGMTDKKKKPAKQAAAPAPTRKQFFDTLKKVARKK